ncbi:MAG: exo-beta-N-acetylmuramidase NamZ family protein, partial [Gammaproteobacteria bacterium]
MPGWGQADGGGRVQTGIDVLESKSFAPLVGKRVGIISNHSGIDSTGDSTINVLNRAPGIKLQAIFSPEHGLSGKRDEKIGSGHDLATGLPVYSLYGDVKKPTKQMLEGLDALVYDIQDVGARFYTYITTMAYAMEAAASAGLDFYVLDRPNPINASIVQGPVMDPKLKSFIGYFPLPLRYGMTAGELASMFNSETGIGAKLHVIKMQGYQRNDWFDDTGLPWVNP